MIPVHGELIVIEFLIEGVAAWSKSYIDWSFTLAVLWKTLSVSVPAFALVLFYRYPPFIIHHPYWLTIRTTDSGTPVYNEKVQFPKFFRSWSEVCTALGIASSRTFGSAECLLLPSTASSANGSSSWRPRQRSTSGLTSSFTSGRRRKSPGKEWSRELEMKRRWNFENGGKFFCISLFEIWIRISKIVEKRPSLRFEMPFSYW